MQLPLRSKWQTVILRNSFNQRTQTFQLTFTLAFLGAPGAPRTRLRGPVNARLRHLVINPQDLC